MHSKEARDILRGVLELATITIALVTGVILIVVGCFRADDSATFVIIGGTMICMSLITFFFS